ncbi:uncharacterized protein LOC124656522 [Lolium rigidum]|uniref:uncharacterized protein LOC124656522 n=1 Tax=Lolium rigidum TaxID=89674 RepID=UPI001F5D0F71|nr:uncharacterized protein LOC124656522 [Lolium rigidum]
MTASASGSPSVQQQQSEACRVEPLGSSVSVGGIGFGIFLWESHLLLSSWPSLPRLPALHQHPHPAPAHPSAICHGSRWLAALRQIPASRIPVLACRSASLHLPRASIPEDLTEPASSPLPGGRRPAAPRSPLHRADLRGALPFLSAPTSHAISSSLSSAPSSLDLPPIPAQSGCRRRPVPAAESVRSLSALLFLIAPTSCAIPSSLSSASLSPQPATHPCPVRLPAAPRSCGRSRSQGRRNIAVEEELSPELDLTVKSKVPSSIGDLVHGQQGEQRGEFSGRVLWKGFPNAALPTVWCFSIDMGSVRERQERWEGVLQVLQEPELKLMIWTYHT